MNRALKSKLVSALLPISTAFASLVIASAALAADSTDATPSPQPITGTSGVIQLDALPVQLTDETLLKWFWKEPEKDGRYCLKLQIVNCEFGEPLLHVSYHDGRPPVQPWLPIVADDGGFIFSLLKETTREVDGYPVKSEFLTNLHFNDKAELIETDGPNYQPAIYPWPPDQGGAYDLLYVDAEGNTTSFRELSGFTFNPHLLNPPGYPMPHGWPVEDAYVVTVRSAEESPLLSRIERAEYYLWLPTEGEIHRLFDGRIIAYEAKRNLYRYNPQLKTLALVRLSGDQSAGFEPGDPEAGWLNVGASEAASIRVVTPDEQPVVEIWRFDLTTGKGEFLASSEYGSGYHIQTMLDSAVYVDGFVPMFSSSSERD